MMSTERKLLFRQLDTGKPNTVVIVFSALLLRRTKIAKVAQIPPSDRCLDIISVESVGIILYSTSTNTTANTE